MQLSRRATLRSLLLLFAALVICLTTGRVTAQEPPQDTRPYLELPYAGDDEYPVTCGYSCYQHKNSMVYAVDFAIPEGDPIMAAAPGKVMAITWEVGLPVSLELGDALIVYIDHGGGWFTRYVHLSGVTVKVGDEVNMGDIIGYSGKSGASGDHLHFELKYGDSLHSPAVPIDELFGGKEPIAGQSYKSNNYRLFDRQATLPPVHPTPTFFPADLVAPAPEADSASSLTAPAADQDFADFLPQVAGGLLLSDGTIRVGEAVTATFTVHNTSGQPLKLSVLGVGTQQKGEHATDTTNLFFDRSITLNPGRSYEFRQSHVFTDAGEWELFVFALGPENEWLPLGGALQPASLVVEEGVNALYLPLITQPSSNITPSATPLEVRAGPGYR